MATAANAARPADADIPAAVRAAFSTNRIQTAWNMACSAQPGDRQAGIEGVVRMLAKDGLKLEDLMTAILAIPAAPEPRKASAMETAFGGFGDIFAEMTAKAKERVRTDTQYRPFQQPTRHLSGADIQSTIHGVVTIEDERPTRNGRMLVITVKNANDTMGPLVCFSTAGIDRLKLCAGADIEASMSVKQPIGENQMPSVTNVRIV
jgi:hypothetical protein